MTWHVYENWTHNKAIVHKSDCSYCCNGKGIHASASVKNGEWHGPYDLRHAAFDKAEATKREEIRACKVCGA